MLLTALRLDALASVVPSLLADASLDLDLSVKGAPFLTVVLHVSPLNAAAIRD